jgi:hypothetical protein
MTARAIYAIALSVASPAAAQVEALAPDNGPVTFQAFADAAVACAQAAQHEVTVTGPIEQRGWKAYAQAPDIAARATTFSRPGAHILVVVLKDPPQCTADWFVSSPSSTNALFSGADDAIAGALKQAFGRRAAAFEVRSEGSRTLRRFNAGDAVVLVRAEPAGPARSMLRLVAMNNDNITKAAHSPAQATEH